MTAAGLIAVFALHVLWQAPLFAAVAWVATRFGRPAPHVAYRLWMLTLALCVAIPAAWTVAAGKAAIAAERASGVTISYDSAADLSTLPSLQRQPAWQRMLHRHFSLHDGLQPFTLTLPQRFVRPIAGLYLLVVAFFALRILIAWRVTRGLVRRSHADGVPQVVRDALRAHCLDRVAPQVRLSSEVAGPVLAGTLHPTLLLPRASVNSMSAEEIDAVLAHELAHLRRRDPLQHAAALLLLVPVAYHPAALWTAQRVRQTREMACDADAAARMRSASRYAHALLQVAERAGSSRAAGGRWGSSLGMFTTGLGVLGLVLFGTSGAMEERMKMILKANHREKGGWRVVRAAACAAFASAAVLTACMLQVQPTVVHAQQATTTKEDAGPALIGGEHAQEQLRAARRQLAEAERNATTDDDRQKLHAAETLAAATQHELAAASESRHVILNVQEDGPLGARVITMPRIDSEAMAMVLDGQQVKLNSPEYRKQMADLKAQLQSPEFRLQLDQARKVDLAQINRDLAEARKQQEQWEKVERPQVERAMADARLQQDQWQKVGRVQMERALADAKRQQADAARLMQSAEVQRQLAEAARVLAQLEPMPAPFAVASPAPAAGDSQQDADKPIKIGSGVMAGNKIGGPQPVYPPDAKEKHISGAVVIHAIIDKTGHVEATQVVSSPDESLSKSAIEAVQKWTYKPYLLNGNPTPVDTTITVNYSFGG